MRTLNKLMISAVAAVTVAACSDDDGRTATSAADPILGEQIERMGRAAINTAITDPFFREDNDAEQARHDTNVDAYDAEDDVREATVRFAQQFRSVLAVYDGADEVCGNQLLAGADPADHRNGTLAIVLANDELYVNTDFGVCEQYLGVELDFVGFDNQDCGGRTPLYDPIEVSYSALVTGEVSGVNDGLTSDGDGIHSNSVFPFLDPPITNQTFRQ